MRRTPRVKAQLAAFVLLFVSQNLAAEELARLFFSPLERQSLNQKRLAPAKSAAMNSPEKTVANADASESVPLPPPRITGRVIRSSGNDTVWMNHSPNYIRLHSSRRGAD